MPQAPRQFRKSSMTTADQAARGLAFFSIALGAAELVFPGTIARALGLQNKGLIRAYGARELATGFGAFQMPHAGPAMWARVAGDVVDLATLALAAQRKRPAATAIAAVAAIGVFDALVATALTRGTARPKQVRDYSDRSGFPGGVAAARGAAASYRTPLDMRDAPAGAAASQSL